MNIGNICACMGPQGKDKLCPCRMRSAGLEPDIKPWSESDKERFFKAIEEMVKSEKPRDQD